MRKLFKERKLFKGGNYMRKYGSLLHKKCKLRTYVVQKMPKNANIFVKAPLRDFLFFKFPCCLSCLAWLPKTTKSHVTKMG